MPSEKGFIVVGMFIHAKGEIEDFRVMNEVSQDFKPVVEAMSTSLHFKFEPAKLDGRAVATPYCFKFKTAAP